MVSKLDHLLHEVKNGRTQLSRAFQDSLEVEKIPYTCLKGCHHCCYHPFAISVFEGALIYNALVTKGLWSQLRPKFVETARETDGLKPEIWLLAKIPCPLLDKGLCQVFPSCPLICRTTYSTSVPDYCEAHKFGYVNAMVERGAVLTDFIELEMKVHRKVRAPYRRYPLAWATLLGEKVVQTDDIEGVDSFMPALYSEVSK